MSKYISIEALKWAADQLRDSANAVFVDFLMVKHGGLTSETPITITTKSTLPAAQALMGIVGIAGGPVDKDHVFFNPFTADWRHEGYPRSGTYSTLDRSKTFSRIVHVERDGGMKLSLPNDYVQGVQDALRRSPAKPLAIPIEALAVWALRYREFDDDAKIDDVVDIFRGQYHLSEAERTSWFAAASSQPQQLFSSSPIDKDAVVSWLLEVSPAAAKQGGAEASASVMEHLPEDLIELLRQELLLPEALLRQLVTLLRAGKHIILTGPPGTGKSTLASRLAKISEKHAAKFSFPSSSGHIFTTATADWTTFDTLGGYMPSAEGKLTFHEGLFLQALRENKWLVIDELNRADADKAFGQLFTVLSGHDVVTPFKRDDRNVSLSVDRNAVESRVSEDGCGYIVGQDWRIIATMNTFDRNLLFQLSAAFVRRFALVHVGIPDQAELLDWIADKGLDERELELLEKLIMLLSETRPLGPAIWSDVVEYMGMRTKHSFGTSVSEFSVEAAFVDALTAFVLPQLDGLDQESLGSVQGRLSEILSSETERHRLSRTFKELF